MTRVFKFGGASVKDANAVKNVGAIIQRYPNDKLIIVISAMGKTTNALEKVLDSYFNKNGKTKALIDELRNFHELITNDLFESDQLPIESEIKQIFDDLVKKCETSPSGNYNFEYDQIVSLGEVISTKIVCAYLNQAGIKSDWIDARKAVATDDKWREARIDWDITDKQINELVNKSSAAGNKVIVSQGFIGHSKDGHTTTLGREGSDFSAAIFAYVLDATDVTIWKDVPGMLNADPKWFDNTVLLEKISFREAIELAYFGASVIHPRTIQPLKRKNIPLNIKSFLQPEAKGSIIQSSEEDDTKIPSFIFRMDQVLISLSPKDFSFIIEENLEEIFAYLNRNNIRVNIMQNSAVSFSFCCDQSSAKIEEIIAHFQDKYVVKYNEPLELVTIRHYDDKTIARVTVGKNVILEQKTRQTARLVMLNI